MSARVKADLEKIKELERIISENKTKYPIEKIIEDGRKEKVIDIVVKTILSQNTSDKLRDIAFSNIKRNFKDMKDIIKADSKKIEKLIRVCGLPKIKTKRMKTALKEILRRFEDPEKMKEEEEEKLFSFLCSIKGIGPKSASVIMAFAGFDTFPVDTHISRIIRRIGIANGSREKIFQMVSPHIKNKIVAHIFLINHGRNICKAKNPKCEECLFQKICEYRKTHYKKK